MQVCQNIEQKLNPKWRRPPSWIFAQTAIIQPPIDIDWWNLAVLSSAATRSRSCDQNRQK